MVVLLDGEPLEDGSELLSVGFSFCFYSRPFLSTSFYLLVLVPLTVDLSLVLLLFFFLFALFHCLGGGRRGDLDRSRQISICLCLFFFVFVLSLCSRVWEGEEISMGVKQGFFFFSTSISLFFAQWHWLALSNNLVFFCYLFFFLRLKKNFFFSTTTTTAATKTTNYKLQSVPRCLLRTLSSPLQPTYAQAWQKMHKQIQPWRTASSPRFSLLEHPLTYQHVHNSCTHTHT